jgi:DNA-binding XRE family transcriptional regulator
MRSNLKKYRNRSGFSLQELGDMCGISKAHVHLLESDKANPTLKNAYAISKILNVAVDDIWPNSIEVVEETKTVRRVKQINTNNEQG